ncbi:hypothetical protein K431DRAFT_281162 [Polychaeton citri CBS 116435]|uniref:Clock-controlled protein 6 n=1 Tax=Polychaeton citri CBS 116435 TaxID=1314669 RepID=A0A9P4UUJ4_9PEZI|nr:hypothetical protein K431DRAFT_281162 [Polychaeton citri CBS 116435]
MRTTLALSLGLAGASMAQNGTYPYPTSGVGYTTEVVTAYTTYCPLPTTVVPGNGKTYTVTSATTLTVLDCPCTISHPLSPPPPPPTSTPAPYGTNPGPGPTYSPANNNTVPKPSSTGTVVPPPYEAGAAHISMIGGFVVPIIGGVAAALL